MLGKDSSTCKLGRRVFFVSWWNNSVTCEGVATANAICGTSEKVAIAAAIALASTSVLHGVGDNFI